MCSFAQISMFQTQCEAQPEKIGWESFSVSLQDATDETLQAHEPGNVVPRGTAEMLWWFHSLLWNMAHVVRSNMWIQFVTGWWFGCHFLFSHNIGLPIIPTDELIFFQRGGPTTNQVMVYLLTWRFSHGYSTLNYQRVCLNFWARI